MEKQSLFKKSARGNNQIDLFAMAKAMWHRAWLIVVTAFLGAAVSTAYVTFLVTPMYSASVKLYVNSSSITVGATSVNIAELSTSRTLVSTYLAILNTRPTMEDIIEETGLDYTSSELMNMITSESVDSTEIFKVTVTCPSAEDAATIANSIATILPDRITSILDGTSVRLVEDAIVNNNQISPNVTSYTVKGFVGGFALACVFIAFLFLMDDTIADENYLLETYTVPMLAAIPDLNDKKLKKVYFGNYDYYNGRGKSETKPKKTDEAEKKV